jgi:hypothetical protein
VQIHCTVGLEVCFIKVNDMKVFCKSCNLPLTQELTMLQKGTLLNPVDGVSLIPCGFYMISDGEIYTNTEGAILLNADDLVNVVDHADGSRLNGCCGLDGTDGPNKTCIHGHEVAIEMSDCWIPWVVIMNREKVFIK